MHVLIYGNPRSIGMDRLMKEVNRVVSPERVEECSTLEGLSNRVRMSPMNQTIAVLLAASREDLSDLLSIRDFLNDILVILILPDRNKDTISSARVLWPRFVAFADSDFGDVAAVLGKMLELMESRITGEERLN
jgi:hypothetical protein